MKKYFKRALCCILAVTVAFISCFIGFNGLISATANTTSATFDFSDASDLEYAIAKYGNGTATVADGALNLSLKNNHCMKTRFPFELENGKTYKVKYDLTLSEDKALLLGVANASSTNSYDGVFNERDRLTISNGSRNAGTHTVEYIFVADITDENYNKLGLIFWATAADATVSVDNLEISLVETDKNYFDFSASSDLEYAIAKYGNGTATVADGALNLSLKNNHCMKVRIPFALENGKEYKVSYDLTLSEDKALLLGVANASSTNSYDGVFDESNRLTISNGNRTAGTHTVEYTFVADITDENYNKLGLIFWATAADATVSVDNLEISLVETDKNYFDFSTSSDLEYAVAKYGNGTATVADGVLNLALQNNRCMKVRFPFTLEDGKEYKVSYDLTLSEDKALLLGVANASSTNSYDGVFDESNRLTISNGNRTAGTHTVEYTFVADITDENYNKLGLIFWATAADAAVFVDNLEIEEIENGSEPEIPVEPPKVDAKFDFSDASHVAAMYAPDGVEIADEAIKITIASANNYAKIKIPVELVNGKTYSVKYKLKAAQDTSTITFVGAYAHKTLEGYNILKNWPLNDTKQVFNVKSTSFKKDESKTIKYEFTADYADGYNYFGLFIQSSIIGTYYIDDLEIVEIEKGNDSDEPQEVYEKFDFSDEEHVSAMYSPDIVEIEDEAIKLQIKTAYNYAKIRIPFELIKGETYHVSFKIKAAQPSALVTVLGAYAHELTSGYDILKNSPMNDTKQVFSIQNVPNFKKDKWKTVTYSFTADYADGYNYFGLFIQSYVLGTYYIDNLEITNAEVSPFKPDEELSIKDYDFSNEEQLDYGSSVQIENGELKYSFDKEWAAGKARFPFVLENGKAYELTFKARSDIMNQTIHMWPAYALAVDNWDVIKNTDKKYVVSQTYRRFYDSDWVECKYTFIADSPEERYKYLGLFMQSTAAGNVWVDDMHIKEVKLVDLKASYNGMDIDMNQLVGSATGDIELPTSINKQFSVEGWYLDAALTQRVGFKYNTDKISSTLYAKVKYNNKFTIDFEGENEDIIITQSNSTTKKMVNEGNNTYLSFSIAKAYDQLIMRTNYVWFPNRSYKLTMRYKFSGTAWLEMGLLKADFTGNSGSGFTQAVVYPMRDTYGICDWKELVIEFDTQDETFEDAFKYIKFLTWFKEGTDAFLSIDDITIEDLGVYKESDFKPHIDEYTWDEFKEDESLYADWKNWEVLKVNENGTYAPLDEENNAKLPLNIIIPIAVGAVAIVAGVFVTVVLIKKKKSKA